MSRKDSLKFNAQQKRAYIADILHDILVGAGAGSGKTKVLSERVNRLMEEGLLSPDEILVLTFTNNAAHEMKSRIIQTFGDTELGHKMLSSHIQTFDSFSSYLVSKYSGELGISSSISLANQSVIDAKMNAILDELLLEYYNDPILKDRLLKTLVKFNIADEKSTRMTIFDLKSHLDSMLPSSREDFINNYSTKYLSKEVFDSCVEEYISYYKKIILKEIYKAHIYEKYYDLANEKGASVYEDAFNDDNNFRGNYKLFSFSDDLAQDAFKKLVDALDAEGDDFLNQIRELYELPNDNRRKKIGSVIASKVLTSLFAKGESPLKDILKISTTFDEEYNSLLSFKDDIELLFELVRKLDERLLEYKKVTNSFTFQDISVMALSLITLPKYSHVAKEVRNQFKYIMVDEYQDTNDFQEEFINSLLQEKEDGSRSHLFCVGDAKQAIYGFRNSKVELFRARQHEYESGDPNHEVIAMNKNYRSGPGLLKDINYIFNYYMTLNHGGIDFLVPDEQLVYDYDVNLYHEAYDDFHVKRLVSVSQNNDDGINPVEWEIQAIISDIKSKVDNKYQIYDRAVGGLRDARYEDFAILMRVTRGYQKYVTAFAKAGIPLNNKIAVNLNEIDAILVIQSLIDMMCYKLYGGDYDVKHLFASIARSYLYEYNDEEIYKLISLDIDELNKDPIMVSIDEFLSNHKDASISSIFEDMISEFSIIKKLYLLNNIDDVVSKIESLYTLVRSEESIGEGLLELSRLFKDINKYKMDFKADSVLVVKDAVDLMTIHGSKGLERKVCYMPYSFNKIIGGGSLGKADYLFSEEFGIILPNYDYDPNRVDEDGNVISKSYKLLPWLLSDIKRKHHNPEVDEHVRLFYVALTRAENTLYIVGDQIKEENSSIKEENLYGMLSFCPHYSVLNETIIAKHVGKAISQELYDQYNSTVDIFRKPFKKLNSNQIGLDYAIYNELYDEIYLTEAKTYIDKYITEIENQLFAHYSYQINSNRDNPDYLASLYAFIRGFEGVNNYLDLKEVISNGIEVEEGIKENYQAYWHNSFEEITADNLKDELSNFVKAFFNADEKYFDLKLKRTDDKYLGNDKLVPICLKDKLFLTLLEFNDGVNYLHSISYKTNEYSDVTETFDYSNKVESEIKYMDKPVEVKVDDTSISFQVREHARASKLTLTNEELPDKTVLERGTYLHRLLELVDLVNKDTSFIKNKWDKKLIDNVLSNHIFDNLDQCEIYKEYGYYDEVLLTNGFIDLLYIRNGEYYIIDYKSKHVDDDDYEEQLHVYQRNVEAIFKTNKDHIHLYLLSISDNKLIEVLPK